MKGKVQVQFLKETMEDNGIYALIDVRERGEFERGHIFGATQVPRRLLEYRMPELVPIKRTLVILCDDDGQRSSLAAHTLDKYGYSNVRYLDGGLNAWRAAGGHVVEGLNVPSKKFGEVLAGSEKIPQISPEELKTWLEKGEDVVVFEVRPPDEVRLSEGSIPGAVIVQGVELPLRIFNYANEKKRIVVTCAGRTRGYIAAQTLNLMGVKHVYDLKNGVMGWIMAGFELQKEIPRGPNPSTESRETAEIFAAGLAKDQGISLLSLKEFDALKKKSDQEILYFFDVRIPEEYEAGHIPDAVTLTGGQAIQCADDFVAVRNGNIVFVCDGCARSVITAYWYKRMGFPHVYVLEGGISAWASAGRQVEKGFAHPIPIGYPEADRQVKKIDAVGLKNKLDQSFSATIVAVDESSRFADGHIPGACWIPRGWIELNIDKVASDKQTTIVVTCRDGVDSALAAVALMEMDYSQVLVLYGGVRSWRAAGLPVETGLAGIEGEPDDVVKKPYQRGRKKIVKYLTWEENLIFHKSSD